METAQTADFEMEGENHSEADRKLIARFSMQSRLDVPATEKEGRNVYKQVEFVTILIPGDKTLNVNRPVMPSDKQRFPLQYAAFKNAEGQALVGTPLTAWSLVNESQRHELAYFNIQTVEALAEVSDSFAGASMGIQKLKQDAQRFLQAQKGSAEAAKLTKELSDRDAKIDVLTAQISQIMAKLAELPPKKEK